MSGIVYRIIAAIALAAVAVSAPAASFSLDFSAAPGRLGLTTSSADGDDGETGRWRLTLGNPEALSTLAVGDELRFALDEAGASFALKLTAGEAAGSVRGWRAAIDGVECASVVFGNGCWYIEISDLTNGLVYHLCQKDGANWLATRHDPMLKPITFGEMPPTVEFSPVEMRRKPSGLTTSGDTSEYRYLDVLFAFDASAAKYITESRGSTLEVYVAQQLGKMNEVLANSKLDDKMGFRFAGIVTIAAQIQSGLDPFDALKLTLGNVTGNALGWEDINRAREYYGADMISVSVDTGSAYGTIGFGYGLSSIPYAIAYSDDCYVHAISVQAAYVHNVEIHETGHNMGAGHSNLQESQGQSSDYSFGYYFTNKLGTCYYTIMAYNIHPITGRTVIACPKFSSPDLIYPDSINGLPAGTPNNDNRRVLLETYKSVAQWRAERRDVVDKNPVYDGETQDEYENGVVATFKGFDTLESGDYVLDPGGNLLTNGNIEIYDDTIRISRGRSWGGATNGISVLVKYSDMGIPTENKALIAFRNTAASTANDNGIGVFRNTDGTIHGIWQGGEWTGKDGDTGQVQVCNKTPSSSGCMVLSYTTAGTILYDGKGSKLYEASGLKTSNLSQRIGDIVSIGGLSGDTKVFGGLVIEGVRIYKGALAAGEIATAVADFEAYGDKEPEVGPVVTKDPVAHTWVVDTTLGEYGFTNDDIGALKDAAWKVTLRSGSELGATIGFGTQTAAQNSHFVFESGAHSMTWLGGNKDINFTTDATAADPSILVKRGATLNLTAKDLTGWVGSAKDKSGNLIRVNDGGTLNLIQSGTSTHYYQGRYWLDPGAMLNADSYAVQNSQPNFRLNGGAVQGYEQLYVPDSTNGSPVATLTAKNGLYLHTDDTKGIGIYVGANAELDINAAITSNDANEPISKWGTGTLALKGALTGYMGALTVNAGTLKLARTTLGGSLSVGAGATLDLAYAGVPMAGTAVLTANGISIANGAKVLVNGVAHPVEVSANAITVAGFPDAPSIFYFANLR